MTDDSNILDQEEWQTVFDALITERATYITGIQTDGKIREAQRLTVLLTNIRDSYLSYENPEDQQEISK